MCALLIVGRNRINMKPKYTNDFYNKTIIASDEYTINLIKDICKGNRWEYTLEENTFTFQEQQYHLVNGILQWHITHRSTFEEQNNLANITSTSGDSELEPFALKRIKICRECEHYKMFMCTQCGCFMPAKTRLKWAECPKQKWLKEV